MQPTAAPKCTRKASTIFLNLAISVMLGCSQSPNLPAQTASIPANAAKTGAEQSMALDANPIFVVATIRPSNPDKIARGWNCEDHGRQIMCSNVTVSDIVTAAYGIHTKQIVGAPEWYYKDKFDISGVPDFPGVPDTRQEHHMYQQLLADRFHLTFHREEREMPIYAIKIYKGSPKLTPAVPGEATNAGNSGGPGFRTLHFTNISMPELAVNLNFYEDRPVIDQTSLVGRYDFTLSWTYNISMEGRSDIPPSLFTAMKEQVGLELDAVKGQAEVFVIDRIEQPTAN